MTSKKGLEIGGGGRKKGGAKTCIRKYPKITFAGALSVPGILRGMERKLRKNTKKASSYDAEIFRNGKFAPRYLLPLLLKKISIVKEEEKKERH